MRRSPRLLYPYFPGDCDPFIRPLPGADATGAPSMPGFVPLPDTSSTEVLFAASSLPAQSDLPQRDIAPRPEHSIPTAPFEGYAPGGRFLRPVVPIEPYRPPVLGPEEGVADTEFDTGLDERIARFREIFEDQWNKEAEKRKREGFEIDDHAARQNHLYDKLLQDFAEWHRDRADNGLVAAPETERRDFRALARRIFGLPDPENAYGDLLEEQSRRGEQRRASPRPL